MVRLPTRMGTAMAMATETAMGAQAPQAVVETRPPTNTGSMSVRWADRFHWIPAQSDPGLVHRGLEIIGFHGHRQYEPGGASRLLRRCRMVAERCCVRMLRFIGLQLIGLRRIIKR